MTDLSSLIERIEKSEGADHDIDAAIELAFTDDRGVQPLAFFKHKITIGKRRTIPFTASIDAAMTLVEPRALWAHGSMEDGPFARICWPRPDGTFTDSYFETNCATVPLSICACALKARTPSHEG